MATGKRLGGRPGRGAALARAAAIKAAETTPEAAAAVEALRVAQAAFSAVKGLTTRPGAESGSTASGGLPVITLPEHLFEMKKPRVRIRQKNGAAYAEVDPGKGVSARDAAILGAAGAVLYAAYLLEQSASKLANAASHPFGL